MAINWLSIITSVVQNAPGIIKMVNELTDSLKQTTGPTPGGPTAPSQPQQPQPPSGPITRAPSETVRSIQKLLNEFMKPAQPLAEDGWMGPKTEAAINDALEKMKPYLSMLGGK